MTKIATLLAGAALALTGGIALAQDTAQDGQMMDHGGMGIMEDISVMPEHMQGMMGAMETMMGSMPMEATGDPDADFPLMMIPHHQSAIDMARVAIEQADDEETRALAQAIIDTQEAESAAMRLMLERLGFEAPAQ